MATRDHRAGFTLVELMIVIIVLGLLAVVTVPLASGYLHWARLSGAVRTLEGDLHYAHSLATEQHKTYQVVFSGNTYSVVRTTPLLTVRTRTMPVGMTCAASDTAAFYAWGLTQPVTVTVSGEGYSSTMQLSANGNISHD